MSSRRNFFLNIPKTTIVSKMAESIPNLIEENSEPANLGENKERRKIIRRYPKSPIRYSELDDFNLMQSSPCYQPIEIYPVFLKYCPSNNDDDHDLSQQSCHMENDTAELIGSTSVLVF